MSSKGTPEERPTKLVVLSAPSGAGKSTLASMLLKRHPTRFKLSISFTTRPPRGEEKDGVHYFFVTESKFKEMIAQGKFLEHALVFGKTWYGTSREFVESALRARNVLFDIDVQGASSLKKAFGARCMTVFIHPPSFEELEKRLRNRKTDSATAIESRLATAREELKEAAAFDHQITNRDLDEAYRELEDVLHREGCL